MSALQASASAAPSRGRYANSGNGPTLVPIDIGHDDYVGLVDPDTAFWSLVKKADLADVLGDADFLSAYSSKAASFAVEMNELRFKLKLSAVYVNPTERCNLNCGYCYIPESMRKSGGQMTPDELKDALAKLRDYFGSIMPEGRKAQIVFHGAEPMLAREAIFAAIEQFGRDFRFGVQTNGTLLDADAIGFLRETGTGIGLSLDAATADIANLTRKTWAGESVFDKTLNAMELLRGYAGHNVICTVTKANMEHLPALVDFFHEREVPTTMFNVVRCTLAGARAIKPTDEDVFFHFQKAIQRTHELFKKTGRKLVVANFANILVSILAPTARRLMCDISPCGGGRVFFALAPDGGMYPCSEFIGLQEFKGGNLFADNIDAVLQTPAFRKVTERNVDRFEPCRRCAVRHFCGSPCPAEAHEMNGSMDRTGAFCEFYEEQVRLAFRIIADKQAEDYLWDGWDKDTETLFDAATML